MADTYLIATRGLKQGFTEEQVAGMLVILFKRTKEEVRPLLDPKGVVVKKGIDLSTATKYKEAIERCGCVCSIEPETVSALSRAGAPAKSASQHDDQARQHIEAPRKSPEVKTPENASPEKNAIPIQKPQELRQPAIPVSETKILGQKVDELALVDWQPLQKPEQESKLVESAATIPVATNTLSGSTTQNEEADENEDDEEIGKIASGQRLLNISVVLSYVFYNMKSIDLPLSFFFTLVLFAMTIIGLLRLTKGLHYSQLPKIIAIPCGLLPLVNLIVLVMTNRQASKRLRNAGFKVGLFGAGEAIPLSHDYRNILIGAFVLTLPVYFLVNYGHSKPESVAAQPVSDKDAAKLEQAETDYHMGRTNAALQELLAMAQAGNTTAMQHLGVLYLNGLGGDRDNFIDSNVASVARDHEQAMFWLLKAADLGDSSAQTALGAVYETGRGEAQNYVQAARWYRLAAQHNDCVAQVSLAWLYGSGHGVPKDFISAYMLLDLAQNLYSTSEACFSAYTWLVYGKLGPYPFTTEDIQNDPNNIGNKRNVHSGTDAQGDMNFLAALMTPQDIAQAKARAAAWKLGDPL